MTPKENLGQMLLAANLIDEVQMKIALAEQARTGKKFGSTLVELKFIDENVLAAFLSKQMDVPCISLLHIDIPKKVLRKIPARLSREYEVVPIRCEGNMLEVAMVDPTDEELVQILESATGMTIIPLIAPQSSVEKMIPRLYPIEIGEDTRVSEMPSKTSVNDPLFRDLIEELESGDFDQRLDRIEENLGEIWILLEKIVRMLENRETLAQIPHFPVKE